MPFGLKNAGATFQRLMRKALGAQMGRNVEAYVDDIVIKTRESHTFIEDLEEMFANLRRVNIKLKPAKCAFGVPSGKLLGFLVSHRRIEANPNKVKAIEEMRPPRNLKEMQHLAGCMAALGRFIARSGEKALPFFKLMKRAGKFEWTTEADKARSPKRRSILPARGLARTSSRRGARRGARRKGDRQRGGRSSRPGGSSRGRGRCTSRGTTRCFFADRAPLSE
jgi:hypothetical protein